MLNKTVLIFTNMWVYSLMLSVCNELDIKDFDIAISPYYGYYINKNTLERLNKKIVSYSSIKDYDKIIMPTPIVDDECFDYYEIHKKCILVEEGISTYNRENLTKLCRKIVDKEMVWTTLPTRTNFIEIDLNFVYNFLENFFKNELESLPDTKQILFTIPDYDIEKIKNFCVGKDILIKPHPRDEQIYDFVQTINKDIPGQLLFKKYKDKEFVFVEKETVYLQKGSVNVTMLE